MPSEDRRVADITLDGLDPVLPGVAKITLRVLKESLSQAEKWFVHPDRWNDVVAASICPLGQVGPSDLTSSCNPLWYDHDPNDIDNRSYGFTFRDFPSSCWAI